MLQLEDESLETAIQLVSKIASFTKTVNANAKEYNYENDYIDVEYIRTDNLLELQIKVLDALNPVRSGLREKDTNRLLTAAGDELHNLKKYGYRSVGNLFHPHLTFTRFVDPQDKVFESMPLKESFSGRYEKLGIFELGENGTCIKEVRTWDITST
jgi:hypothetical protein